MGGISGTLSEYRRTGSPSAGASSRRQMQTHFPRRYGAAPVGTEAEYAGCGDVYQRAANGSR